MFALRRAAVRAALAQPTRQLRTLKPVSRSSIIRLEQTSSCRSLHQSHRWLANEEQNRPVGAAEAVTTEPSDADMQHVKTESVATPETTENPSQSIQERASEVFQSAKDTVGSAMGGARRPSRDAGPRGNPREQRRDPFNGEEKPPSKIIYVGNLFFEVTAPQLEAEFGKIGEVVNSRVVSDSRGLSKGFGYVEFATQEAATRAVQELDQRTLQGRRMAVQYNVQRRRDGAGSTSVNPASKTLFVGNMSYQMSDRDLNDLFRDVRNVLDVRVAIDRRSGQPRGFAHADFIDIESAQVAKELLEKKIVYGRQLRIDYSATSQRESRRSDSEQTSERGSSTPY